MKKCKSFLSTLIKLASTGKQSTETAASVRELVKDLLVSEPNTQETLVNPSTAILYKMFHKKKNPSCPFKVQHFHPREEASVPENMAAPSPSS